MSELNIDRHFLQGFSLKAICRIVYNDKSILFPVKLGKDLLVRIQADNKL